MYTFIDSFTDWLAQVDAELADHYSYRDALPYHLHQWWDMWDAHVAPDDAVTAALLLQPARTKPWPGHAVYAEKSATIPV